MSWVDWGDLIRSSTSTIPSVNAPIRSGYKKRQQYRPPNSSNKNTRPCKGCGRMTHEGKTMARKDCPAFNKNCSHCGIKGHFRIVCQKKIDRPSSQSQAATEPSDTNEQITDESQMEETSFAFATSQDFQVVPNTMGRTWCVDHHTWNGKMTHLRKAAQRNLLKWRTYTSQPEEQPTS